jgi:hypothetical protein
MENIGRLRLRSFGGRWDDALRDAGMLARLGTRVSHVVLDIAGDESKEECTRLLQALASVMDADGTIEVRCENLQLEAIECWTGSFTPHAVYFNGQSIRVLDSDSEDEDDFHVEWLGRSVTETAVTRQERLWRLSAAARVIRRALRRFVAWTRAARTIQRAWRMASGDPYGEMGDRLLRARFFKP